MGEGIFKPITEAGFPVVPYYERLEETWLWRYMQTIKTPTTHSAGDNPEKNTLAYHCVNHQKFAWILKASILNPQADPLVWMDYGIGHVPGVTATVIIDFLKRVKPGDFAIPGCWERQHALNNDLWPCWRFCGGLMVVPKEHTLRLYKAVKKGVVKHLEETANLSWEVNTLARIEATLPIRWYKADHNETMFTGY